MEKQKAKIKIMYMGDKEPDLSMVDAKGTMTIGDKVIEFDGVEILEVKKREKRLL